MRKKTITVKLCLLIEASLHYKQPPYVFSSSSSSVCVSPAGLLNLEQLLRQFLISKETLSVRMLDDSQDPTPLLKEIRDDKTATIIVDANATMSHIILERVRTGFYMINIIF